MTVARRVLDLLRTVCLSPWIAQSSRRKTRRNRPPNCSRLRGFEALEQRSLLSVTLLSEGFEGSFPSDNGWSRGDANSSGISAYWDDVSSTFGGEGTHGGSRKGYAAGIGYAGTSSTPKYQDSMSAYMSRSINLSGLFSASLTFHYRIPSIESGNYDHLRAYVDSTKVFDVSSAATLWTPATISLNPYLGGSRTLKFVFYSDSSRTGEGAYLDDILVTGQTAVDTTAPTANLSQISGVTSPGGTSLTFNVAYSDNIAVRVSSLDSSDIRVTGPNGYSQLATFVTVNTNSNGTPRTATYRISAPGGSWNGADNGTYTVAVQSSQVSDINNNYVASGTFGTFGVNIAGAFAPVFADARITARIDRDGDGFLRRFDLQFDINSNVAGQYYVKAYEYDGGSIFNPDDFLLKSSTFSVNGTAIDYQTVTIVTDNFPGSDLLSHGTVEFKLELYDASTNSLKQTWTPSNDFSLANVNVELSGEDPMPVPAYSSRPVAPAKLYLDFNGDYSYSFWWDNISFSAHNTPAYSEDVDTSSFSAAELATINEVWARVSEKYSPFNLDVTTIDPGNLDDNRTFRIVIGGDGRWYRSSPPPGVANVGGFSNILDNTGWVFANQSSLRGNAKDISEAVAHEAGHGFGLSHQSTINPDGSVTEYNLGDSVRAPIMGASYSANRGIWWNGSATRGHFLGFDFLGQQDDVAVLAGNVFGFRADDRGDCSQAAPLSQTGNWWSGAGVIERTSDRDCYSFSTAGGSISAAVQVARFSSKVIGMLDATLELRNSAGNLVVSAQATSNLDETLTASLTAGTYYVLVGSAGNYGDVGQYSVTATVTDSVTPTANLAAVAGVTVGGGTSLSFNVTYADNVAVNVSSLDSNDIRVTGANGLSQLASFVSVNSASNGTPRTATYRITPPGGSWDSADNGTYTASMVFSQVSDTSGNYVAGGTLGTFTVNVSSSTGSTVTVSSPNVPRSISDYSTTTSTLSVSGLSGTIQDINATVNISHTWDGDLIISLVSPAGREIVLANRVGSSGDNFSNTVLDDEASTAISSGAAPFSGSYQPSSALTGFDGQNPNGTWTLRVSDNAGGDVGTLNSWSITLATSASNTGQMLTFSSNSQVAIPDLSTVNSTLSVSGVSGQILDLNVRLDISHTWDSDLIVTLISPSGTQVVLFSGVGGNGDNFTNTVFDDEASTSIMSASAPFSGTYRAQNALTAFDGLNPTGTWTLRVQDTAGGDLGTLNSWSIVVTMGA